MPKKVRFSKKRKSKSRKTVSIKNSTTLNKDDNHGASGIQARRGENKSSSLEHHVQHIEGNSTLLESESNAYDEGFASEVNLQQSHTSNIHADDARADTGTSRDEILAADTQQTHIALPCAARRTHDRSESPRRHTASTSQQRSDYAKIFDKSREQFIEGEWENDCLVNLHYAQFKTGKNDYIRIYGLDNLYAKNRNNFVARISFQPFRIRHGDFRNMRKEIESKIIILRILDDDLKIQLEASREKFKSVLKLKETAVTVSREAQRDMFHLLHVIHEMTNINKFERKNENTILLCKILNNKFVSQNLINETKILYQDEKNYSEQTIHFPIVKEKEKSFSWRNYISKTIRISIESLKAALITALPNHSLIHSGPADINKLQDRQVLTCSVRDVQLFSDLELSIRQSAKTSELVITKYHDFTHDYVNQLWKLFMTKIKQCLLDDIPDAAVHTSPVFLQLFKTFLDLLNFVCEERNADIFEIVAVNIDGNLNIIENTEKNCGIYENRLKFIVSLMNHFKPGDINKVAFTYQFSFLKINNTLFNRLTGFIVNMFDISLSDIPQKYIIWLYFVHKSFTDLFQQKDQQQGDSKKSDLYSFLNSLLELFISAIKSSTVSLEKVRILANSLIKFATTISPYFLGQAAVNEEDFIILFQQAEYLRYFVAANDQSVNDVTNIVDVYQVFWEERRNLFTELVKQYSQLHSAMDELVERFNTFIKYLFNLKVYNNKFLTLLRSHNEFMRLLRATDFPWYIEKQNILSETYVQLINANVSSYIVKNIDKFIQSCLNNSINLPKHFLFDLSKTLINCVEEFLGQNDWAADDKIVAASDLLLLMGRSLINFNKLPNAVDFQHFYAIFTEPFKRVTQNSSDIYDFKKRLGSLENYYKYTMEINVMSVAKALQLCKENIISTSLLDYSINFEQLNMSYEIYLDKFNNYVDKYILQQDFDIDEFAEKIMSKVKPLDISKWDSQYKYVKIPKLLAGLSAVWSALESRDVISQKQVVKPHCIQILCVLRLLGADQARAGLDSHLAQVLTGQGKSLVLALLAAALALTGNRVRIVCYNQYLANRDQNNFFMFYSTFNIENQIQYGTFEHMANEVLKPTIKGISYELRKFVTKLVTNELPRMHETEEKTLVAKTVLLIDEVDVFFSPEFYGNTYNAGRKIGSETFAEMQIKIWNLTANNTSLCDIKEIIQKFIDEKFMYSTDDTFIKIVRYSRIILNKHVEVMISDARSVLNSSPGDWYSRHFKLQDDGRIIKINDNGEHSEGWCSYKNVFMYFNLKKINFEHINFYNYGYLQLDCGQVSYAKLPTNYRAILGVTGTLKQLSNVELRAVSSYHISRGSDMPTFFGASRLRISNFTVKATEAEWTRAILDSILCVVEQGRAVIVFFEDEYTIDTVRGAFTRHLSRYSVLTGNEAEGVLAACVEEAGVARRVTVATRRMGRGVDFQSNDSAVEAKGGVHAIQTFFSDDVKEETQIKGRTARKDNSGSYEAILCREHLTEAGYEHSACSYSQLDAARAIRAERKGTKLEKSIEESQKKHDAAMKFMKSVYNYNPDKRHEYLGKYPFVDC